MMHFLRILFWLSAQHNFRITAVHVPGCTNTLADDISRLDEALPHFLSFLTFLHGGILPSFSHIIATALMSPLSYYFLLRKHSLVSMRCHNPTQPFPLISGSRGLLSSLHSDVIQFRQAAYAPNTKASYRTHHTTYLQFCQAIGEPPVPAGTNLLCLYAAYLARFLAPKSVRLYLNFVALLHKDSGLPNLISNNWVLQSVLSGIKRVHGRPPSPKEPVTLRILYHLRSSLNLNNSFHASFWAVCLTAFFGFFRKSHLLPSSATSFNPHCQLTRQDSILRDFGYIIQVRWSKTIQFGQRSLFIPLVRCPVRAIQHAYFFHLWCCPYQPSFSSCPVPGLSQVCA